MDNINENLTTEQETAITNQDVTNTPGVVDVSVLETSPEPIPEQPATNAPQTASIADQLVQLRQQDMERAKLAQEEANKLQADQSEQEMLVRTLSGETLGQGAAETQALADAGVGQKQSEIDALDSAILAASTALKQAQVQDERDVQSLAGRGRGIPASVVRGRQALMTQQRNADRKVEAIELENDIATSQLLQGKVENARKSIQRAVALKFEDKRAELAVEQQFLSRVDSKESKSRQEAIRREEKVMQKFEEEANAVFDVATMASTNGAPASIVAQINKAENKQEALELAGRYSISITNRMAQAKRAAEIDALGLTTETDKFAVAEATEKVEAINSLITDPNLDAVIAGTKAGVKIGGSGKELAGGVSSRVTKAQRADVVASVESIVSGLTLDELASAKERGVTFGALSEQEMITVAAAASRIGQRRITNKSGTTIGYRGTEGSVQEDLKLIQDAAKRDFERRTGQEYTEPVIESEASYVDGLETSVYSVLAG